MLTWCSINNYLQRKDAGTAVTPEFSCAASLHQGKSVDGYSVVEQEAGESKNRAYDEKAVDAFFVVLGAHYQAAADEAYQHVRYGGQGAEQAFGVEFQTDAAHCVGIHMVGAEYLVVDYGYDVGVGECKAVAENQQGRV